MDGLQYNDRQILERAILSCLLMKPELTNQLTVKADDFSYNRGIFLFMTEFYKRYENYDLTLMVALTVEKAKIINNLKELLFYSEPTTSNFKAYQEQLKILDNFERKEKENIKAILNLTIKLKSRIISVEDFKKEVEKI